MACTAPETPARWGSPPAGNALGVPLLTCRNPGGAHVHADWLRGPRVASLLARGARGAALLRRGPGGGERARGARRAAQGRKLALHDRRAGAVVELPQLLHRAAVALRVRGLALPRPFGYERPAHGGPVAQLELGEGRVGYAVALLGSAEQTGEGDSSACSGEGCW